LRDDELAPYKVDAWKEHCRLENEAIFEPSDWQEYRHDFSPSSEDRPEKEKIAHRMGFTSTRIPHALQNGNNNSRQKRDNWDVL